MVRRRNANPIQDIVDDPKPDHMKTALLLFVVACIGLSSACSNTAISPQATNTDMPESWVRAGAEGDVELNWLAVFDDPQLTSFVGDAINFNYGLEQERARLAEAEQAVVVTRANRFPTLDISLAGSRRGFDDNNAGTTTLSSFDAGLDARWEVDLWGKLSKQQQSAQLRFAAQQSKLLGAERDLAIETAANVFRVMEARQLLLVADRRLQNAIESHDIVESGYRQGLNEALSLYLARNQVERQEANIALQRQLLVEASADLQLALARYPDGKMEISRDLPVVTQPVPVGLPSELLMRRTDLQEAWLNLHAADADLAAAHKARFPSLSLVGSAGVTSLEFSELLSGDGVSWSLLSNLSQPLFNGGRLAAQEEQAVQRVRQTEQQYLGLVQQAFAEVEIAISNTTTLRQRYESFLDAEINAHSALNLALDQFRLGLVTYTIVLESQRQAFDAETTVVQLRNQQLQNRLLLYQALGGDFSVNF